MPTMSEAWETVVRSRPENWIRNWRGTPKKEDRQEEAPGAAVEAGWVGDEEWDVGEGGEQEAVEDHVADVHFGEGDFAEEEAAAPEGAGEGAGGESESAVWGHGVGGGGVSVGAWVDAIG